MIGLKKILNTGKTHVKHPSQSEFREKMIDKYIENDHKLTLDQFTNTQPTFWLSKDFLN